ncbi:hypothetical protein FB45DRAFT_919097 [Roridomyces roridus]|uniref:BAH domain-containing protein n=1 Tax=Roridomyces roridus TaxID=1738132 RepID=A0AAD7BRT0_9AGAR|nr:hypothetical protein FB45DRAFT_919097 [Roridomyces roridus]
MPKARRARLTRQKKKNAAGLPLGREKNAPTEEEWAQMQHYTGFSVVDTQQEEFQFEAGQVALVWPNGRRLGDTLRLQDYWVCRIQSIRATTPENVLHWFYAKHDATAMFPALSHIGEFERLESNHADCISSSVFDGKIDMKQFDESTLYPEPIQDGELYFRYTIDVNTKTISPAVQTTCTCNRSYNPSDDDPGSLMHFCSRPSCQKYFHSRCIANEPAAAAERDRGFLLLDPDSDDRVEIEDALAAGTSASASAPRPKKKKQRSNRAEGSPIPVLGPAAAQIFSNLPPALVKAAEQPIVRGAAFRAGGVVGNISAVMAARRLVFHSLRTGEFDDENWEENMPERWEELVNVTLEDAEGEGEGEKEKEDTGGGGSRKRKLQARCNGKGKAVDRGEILALNCPKCGGPI